ncbi:MAG: hypothetical protein KJ559_01190 [Nanoarchaeota archaeon]|nr:hypothetical protein [Nanoarchaeota archaeon]
MKQYIPDSSHPFFPFPILALTPLIKAFNLIATSFSCSSNLIKSDGGYNPSF